VQGVADDERRMTIVEHLEELRRVLIISGAAWVVATIVAFVFNRQVIAFLERPIVDVLGQGNHLVKKPILTDPLETITVPLKISSIVGIIAALPVIVWQFWGFVKPGLRPVERRFAGPFIASSLILFAVGAAFAYLVMPLGLNFLANFLGNDIEFLPNLNEYLSFLVILILVFGVTFELPVVILLLGLLGIVSSKWLRARRKAIYVGIIFTALVVTPGADPFTPTALAIPLLVLFEVSIVILSRVLKR
jgi:sec-independent protein translocase protein TatC